MLPANVRAFLEEPHYAVMATINASGTPQLTVMWYALHPTEDFVLLNGSHGLLKVKNLRRDPRMALCVEDGPRYVTVEGTAELVADRTEQEREVNEHIAHATLASGWGAGGGRRSRARTGSASACGSPRCTRAGSKAKPGWALHRHERGGSPGGGGRSRR